MHTGLRLGYEGAARLARFAASIATLLPFDTKPIRALRARHGIVERYRDWGRTMRNPARPLLWMHAPSVGEGLQARPVLELMREYHPAVQLAYTHFSPSAESFARGLDVDFRDYLPFDASDDSRTALDALRPAALVFAKLDVWPNLTMLARARGVRLGLISATLAEASSRRSPLASAVLRDAYAALDAVGAIHAADAERLVSLGVNANVIVITGDTRYDQVWKRAELVDRGSSLLAPLSSSRPTIVAGSTWPSDERVLLPAFARVRQRVPDARLIIAPHEPTPAHLEPIERWAAQHRVRLDRLGQATTATDIALVDRLGVLGELYALADVAFVGGGFHSAGLHSVLEPAAFGAPVLFGPGHASSREALVLLTQGAGRAVADEAALADALIAWLTDADLRAAAGRRAADVVRAGRGAASRSLRVVESLLDARP
jgi:3-deoxy-D-manno-octulosonic-acid transferase